MQIDLEVSGKNASRIVGRGFATFDDIRVVGDRVDLRWDSLDTIRHVAKEYATQTTSKEVEFERDFGVIIRDPGTGTEPKTAFVGYEIGVAGAPTSLVKLQLQKDENGWRVANALPSDQIDDAHPLDTTAETRWRESGGDGREDAGGETATRTARVHGSRHVCLLSIQLRGWSWQLRHRYQLSERLGRNCYVQNYRMAYRDESWVVVGEIGPEERVEVRTGAIVKQKPSMFGCGRRSSITW